MGSLDLSIIVPLLNDSGELSEFFATLSAQRSIKFELLICDGGSPDGGRELADELGLKSSFACRVIDGERGRARQMNAGARCALAPTLLFLHVDSRFDDEYALQSALQTLNDDITTTGSERIAGHFPLHFRRQTDEPSLPYSYYSCKARLDRSGCTHGDQGFLLRASYFDSVGPFDEQVSVLEDTRLADKIRRDGCWLLLPAEITTSARRFEMEGLYERQILNLLIMNFAAIGWDDFFCEARDIYRSQDRVGQLQLLPFIELILQMTARMNWRERWALWYRTGCYVRPQAWQIALYFDVRRNFHQGLSVAQYRLRHLERFDGYWDLLTDHVPGRFAATVLTWCWFRWLHRSRIRCEKG